MQASAHDAVRRAATSARDPRTAASELAAALQPDSRELVVFFASPDYDPSALAPAIAEAFEGTRVIGCTTAGEFGPCGYREGSLSGFALDRDAFDVELVRLDGLKDMELHAGTGAMRSAIERMEGRGLSVDAEHCFAFMLVHGLSMREEALVSSLYVAMDGISLFGGSAGDNLDFGETLVFHGDRFVENAAVVALIRTKLPFEVFRTQHFDETEARMVITEADPLTRFVTEINGEPAADEYARAVGLELGELTPQVFATYPVLLRVGGETYVRSIAKVNDDGSLSFFCAIEPGTVLTVAKGGDLVATLETQLEEVRSRVGPPLLTIGCDCILRSLETQRDELREQVADVLERFETVGFATYGEQFNAMHVNQTFTGVMIGRSEA
ncbi:MAG: nitric oxide-sensing protein NosP [Planctomycetota bacterium]